MRFIDRVLSLVAILAPAAGFAAAILSLAGPAHAADFALFAVFYLLAGFGVTVGFHRLLAHRAFATSPRLLRLLARLGQLSVQGGVIDWVADHRKHHAHSDAPGDPHSPGQDAGLKGLWHAHAGWLMVNRAQASWASYAPDLAADPALLRIQSRFLLYSLASVLLPAALGWALHADHAEGAQHGFLWGGLARIFVQHHVTWSINSLTHWAGRRPFAVRDRSTNLACLALPSLGEAWHNNHHAFPRSARHGVGAGQLDLSAMVIETLARFGLVWDVVTVSAEQQAVRLRTKAGGADPAAAEASGSTSH